MFAVLLSFLFPFPHPFPLAYKVVQGFGFVALPLGFGRMCAALFRRPFGPFQFGAAFLQCGIVVSLQAVEPRLQPGAGACQLCAQFLQPAVDPVAQFLQAENALEHFAPFFLGKVKKLGKGPLRQDNGKAEIFLTDAEQFLHPAGDLGRLVGKGEGRIGGKIDEARL